MKEWKELLVVGAGGFAGAILRWWVSGWVQRASQSFFPYGTLAVNSAGSFCLGFLAGLSESAVVPPRIRLLIGVGVLGAFTTFSTFSYETLMLLRSGSYGEAFLNIVFSLVSGLILVYAGFIVGQSL